jgi:uncharacterized protein (DUF2141 family)
VRPRRLLALPSLLGALLAAAPFAVAPYAATRAQEPSPGESKMTVEIRTRGNRGLVFCALFSNGTGFPTEAETRAIAHQRLRPEGRRVTCTFSGHPPGTYAISAFHDENGNGKLDTGLFGIPSEGWGTSRNAAGSMGPPSWADARFRYAGGSVRLREAITLRY